jgi:uncharacterized protein YlzI (FlbEa/FlbD family)
MVRLSTQYGKVYINEQNIVEVKADPEALTTRTCITMSNGQLYKISYNVDSFVTALMPAFTVYESANGIPSVIDLT